MIEIPPEFEDYKKVLEHGALKYGENSWMRGEHFNHRDNTSSMFRHLAEHYTGVSEDPETGLDPLLHLACRALMRYTMKKRGLIK